MKTKIVLAVFVLLLMGMLTANAQVGQAKDLQKISELSGNGPDLDAEDYFGVSVAGVGDLDGDGVEDMAVGTPWDDDGAPDAGAIYVLMLKVRWPPSGFRFSISKILGNRSQFVDRGCKAVSKGQPRTGNGEP